MDKVTADKIISEYVKKLYGFAVSKTYSLDEAEELSAQIVLEVYRALLSKDNIYNLNGYIYRIASNVFARHVEEKKKCAGDDSLEEVPDSRDVEAGIIQNESEGLLRREITYLSKIQRETIILHYFKEKKISEIAKLLEIPENTVKWHLACSRKELKTGMDKIRTTGVQGTQPVRFLTMGHDGRPGAKGDTRDFLARSITQNIAYAAYHQPRNINEIAQELGINPIFIEDEVAVLEEYGYMDLQKDGRYLTNILIHQPDEEKDCNLNEMKRKYARLFAEKFFAPVLNSMTEIPDWLHVPDNDLNLFKWAFACFLKDQLETVNAGENPYSVKRPDGGDFVAFAVLEAENPDAENMRVEEKYWFCGDMWRDHFTSNMWWKSWQGNCAWTDREGDWRENLYTDYDKLDYFLRGELPEADSNIESYKRLLDKGYLLKKDGEYKVNMILCDSEEKWWGLIPEAGEEVLELSREYAKQDAAAQMVNQPPHMHGLIQFYSQNSAKKLLTRILEQLLAMGVLKEPSNEQKKGLLTVMFTGK